MRDFANFGGTVITLTPEQRREWAQSVPDLAGDWVANLEARGLPGRRLLEDYMDVMRANNQPIMRHWDRE